MSLLGRALCRLGRESAMPPTPVRISVSEPDRHGGVTVFIYDPVSSYDAHRIAAEAAWARMKSNRPAAAPEGPPE